MAMRLSNIQNLYCAELCNKYNQGSHKYINYKELKFCRLITYEESNKPLLRKSIFVLIFAIITHFFNFQRNFNN